jgi:GDP-4-dehydro-6-deoxy-D-mannose reductase
MVARATMRALVTGASGFAGAHLCRRLRELGYELATAASSGDVDYHIDVRDRRAVASAVEASAPDYVLHLAGVAHVLAAEAQSEQADAVNRGGTANVLDAAFEVGARTLVVSSGAVYGRLADDELPAREDMPPRPQGAYAVSKVAAEAECRRRAGRQEVIVVRAFNHTGPGQARGYVCSDFAAQIAEREAGLRAGPVLVGELRSARDFTDVRDVVDAYVRVLERGAPGETYNVCSGRAVSAGQVLEILRGLAGVDVDVRIERQRLRAGGIMQFYGSNAKLAAATGWEPAWTFEATLADLLDDWRERVRKGRTAP